MPSLRCLASCALALSLAPVTWAQEPEEPASATAERVEAPAGEPEVDAFQYFFGRREESPAEGSEAPAAAPAADPEAKRDAFQYLFGRRTQAATEEPPVSAPDQPGEQEPAKVEPARRPVARRQPAPEQRQTAPTPKPSPVTAPAPALTPAPVQTSKAQPAEPQPAAEAASPLPEERKDEPAVKEKPTVDAFQYFFGSKAKPAEPADSEQEKKEGERESERPPL